MRRIQATVGSRIAVHDAPPEVLRWCRENLIIDNPQYYKLERLGKWTGNTPQRLFLYEIMGDDVWIPFGCIRDYYKDFPFTSFKTLFQPLRRFSYNSNIKPYPYQEEAVKKALEKKNGVLVMPCGAGKTQTALEIVSRIGGRTLWLTHTHDLLKQSMNRAKSVFRHGGYGTITAGKVHAGEGITFATIQTLSKIDLSEYRNCWDVVIVDECQHCCGTPTRLTQFYKVLSRLCARYKFGLTATPRRADGLEQSMFAILGGVIHEVSRQEVAEMTCPVKVQAINTGYMPDYNAVLLGDGTLNYSELVNDMTANKMRFKFVLDTINGLDGTAIVLANRVEYLKRLNESFQGRSVCLSDMGTSNRAKAEREAALRKLNEGELDAIFATYQLAKEGLDVPSLRYVVFATPEKDPTTIEQSIGRVGRKADGKSYGTAVDFVDDFGMYKGWWKKRLSVYKKIGCDIIN